MWLCLNDAFLSIVSKDCGPHQLLVRARRPGDIEKILPGADVRRTDHEGADYLFRAVVDRGAVVQALAEEVGRINYPNFKDSVDDRALHDAYMRVWIAMLDVQPRQRRASSFLPLDGTPHVKKPKKRGRRSMKKGR